MAAKINSVDKAVNILNCFTPQEPVRTVGVISKITGYTLSTVSRLLSTLEVRGVVQKLKGHGRYQLGHRIYLWGQLCRAHNNLAAAARPAMETLRDRCGEEVSLHIVIDGARSILERVPSKHAIAMTCDVGGRLPLHAGAAGRVLMAFMDENARREYIENVGLVRFTENTLTDTRKLNAELEEIRRQGCAFSREEREPGAYSLVAPVREGGGRVVASLCIAGPLYRLTDELAQVYLADVQAAAVVISRSMGYAAPA